MATKRPLAQVAARALAPLSPEEVVARILCGEVLVDGERVRDPKRLVEVEAAIRLAPPRRFVSRGGHKLEHALSLWELPVEGRVFLDAGCSTGGFTDCLLQHGAERVFAVDVGRNQIAYALRCDPRVVVLEGTNVMSIRPGDLRPAPHAAVADLAFRSLRGAAAHLLGLTREGWLVALVKPQFEVQGDRVAEPPSRGNPPRERFDGVVRDRSTLIAAVEALARDLWSEGAFLARATVSPLRGRRGNVELLFDLRSSPSCAMEEALRGLLRALDEIVA